jgi:hypothetical protein
MKTSGFRGRCASGIASLRSRRLFIHSLLTGSLRSRRTKSQPALSEATSIDVRVYGGGTVALNISDYREAGKDKDG